MNWVCDVFFIICWYEWNQWMLSLLFTCLDGIFECFLNRMFKWMESVNMFYYLLTWMEYVNVFTICVQMFSSPFNYMNGVCACFLHHCLYEWNKWMFSSSLFIRMESVNVFFIVCLYEGNQWKCFLIVNSYE